MVVLIGPQDGDGRLAAGAEQWQITPMNIYNFWFKVKSEGQLTSFGGAN